MKSIGTSSRSLCSVSILDLHVLHNEKKNTILSSYNHHLLFAKDVRLVLSCLSLAAAIVVRLRVVHRAKAAVGICLLEYRFGHTRTRNDSFPVGDTLRG